MPNKSIDLTKMLVDRKILTEGTTISARVSVAGFGHTAIKTVKEGVITKIAPDGLIVAFEDKKPRKTKYENIVSIEGMDIARFAQAYRIKGNNKKA